MTGVIRGPRTGEWKQAHSERISGEKHHQFGVPLTEETKKKISEANSGEKHPNYGKFGAAHNCSKAIIATEPDGTQRHYGSCITAARELGIPKSSLCYFLKNGHVLTKGSRKGWQFHYKTTRFYSKTG